MNRKGERSKRISAEKDPEERRKKEWQDADQKHPKKVHTERKNG